MKLTAVVTENWETEPRESDLFLQLLCLFESVFCISISSFSVSFVINDCSSRPKSSLAEIWGTSRRYLMLFFVFFTFDWIHKGEYTSLMNTSPLTVSSVLQHFEGTLISLISCLQVWSCRYLKSCSVASSSSRSSCLPPAEPASDFVIQYFSQYFFERKIKMKKKTVKITGLNITKRLVLTVALRWTEM